MSEEPTNKRRRIDGEVLSGDAHNAHDGDGGDTTRSPSLMQAGASYGFENIDPFLSPATASSWAFDEFAHDPDYLASQEALRSLMFDTARSVAPTRAGTPVEAEDLHGMMSMKHVLVHGRRMLYLKNYMSQVAPWVS